MRGEVALAVAMAIALDLAGGGAAANGGWTEDYFDTTSGPVYAGKEHPSIVLDKEVLKLVGFDEDGSSRTTVHYEFVNTFLEYVVVDAAFPVEIWIELEEDGKQLIVEGNEKGAKDGAEKVLGFAKAVFGKKLEVSYDGERGRWVGRLARADAEKDEIVDREAFEERLGDHVEFHISQDGAPLDVPSVAIQTRVATRDVHDVIGWQEEAALLSVTLHFRYEKTFAAGARSLVDVGFRVPGLVDRSSYGWNGCITDEYSWAYRLGPGGTWKGPIGMLYVVAPEELSDGLFDEDLAEDLGQVGSMHVFLARDFEPAKDDPENYDNFLYAYWGVDDARDLMDIMIEMGDTEEAPTRPWLDFVEAGEASSVGPGKADVYSRAGIFEGVGFGPLSMLDGIDETAWCTEPGKGVGEWVEIAIDRDMLGMSVVNGFAQAFTKVQGEGFHKSFGRENRVKTLEIVSDEGEVLRTLEIEDAKGDQDFLDVELPAGTYRLRVADIYRGKKKAAAARTCLGEVVPYPDNEVLHSDPFLAKYFWLGYQDAAKQ